MAVTISPRRTRQAPTAALVTAAELLRKGQDRLPTDALGKQEHASPGPSLLTVVTASTAARTEQTEGQNQGSRAGDAVCGRTREESSAGRRWSSPEDAERGHPDDPNSAANATRVTARNANAEDKTPLGPCSRRGF